MKILDILYERYYQIGFATFLYDALSPTAYLNSVKAAADQVQAADRAALLDLGCGSGLLLRYLDPALTGGLIYIGTDRLISGLLQLKRKASDVGPQARIHGFRSDILQPWPLRPGSFDCVVAHFCVYTLPRAEDRHRVYENIAAVLKPGGRAVVSNPSVDYNARRIIQESLQSQKATVPPALYRLRRYLFYPLAQGLGLRHIQKQLQSGVWHAYSRHGLCAEVEAAGLRIEQMESVYAGSGYLVVARKP